MFLFIAFVCIGLLWWRIIRLGETQRDLNDRLMAGFQRWNILEREVADLRRDARGSIPAAEPPRVPTPQAPPMAQQPEQAPLVHEPEPKIAVEPAEDIRAAAGPPPLPTPPLPTPPLPMTPTPMPPPVPTAPPPLPAMAAAPARTESMLGEQVRKSGGWEELIGGNLLNKLGALVLVIGIALFLSYSFAQMGPAGRAFTGLGVSAAILGGGVWLERKERYRIFSRGVIAAGWGSLYFTVYAMHAMPAARIIESPAAGVLAMLAVAAGMVAHSLKYRVETLTALSYGTVFAALALSTQNTFVAVALVPLAGSMLYLARRFGWYGMAVFGAVATYVTFLTRPSEGSPLMVVQSLLLLYWAMFEAFDLMRIQARAEDSVWTRGLFWVNALAGLGASAAVWQRLAPDDMWQFCAAGAALYLASMWVRFLLDEASRYEYALLISALLAGLAIFAGVEGIWDSVALLVEAEVLFLAGMYLRIRFARALSWIGFAAAWLQMVTRIGDAPIALLGTSVDVWAPPLGVMAVVFYVNRHLAKQVVFGHLASGFVWAILGTQLPWRWVGAAWLAFGALLFELGKRRDWTDYRLRGHAVTLSGVIGMSLHQLNTHEPWALAGGTLVVLGNAIRGSRWLTALPEMERTYLRISGSLSAALLGGLLMTRLAPDPYWGIAMVGCSLALFELAFRRLPVEMTIPAGVLSVTGFVTVVLHSGTVQKFPDQSVWAGFAGAALGCYYLTARLLRAEAVEQFPIRFTAPWLGSIFAAAALWMVLPNAYVPAAIAALGLAAAEAGLALGAADLMWLGRAITAGSVIGLFRLELGSAVAERATGMGLAASQWWLWWRTRKDELASAHGWAATFVLGALIPWQAPAERLALWGLLGAALAAGGRGLGLRDLRWQAAVLAVIVSVWSIGMDAPLWQDASAIGFLAAALLLEMREAEGSLLRKGYSVAAALVTAAMLRAQVSGGMLTLSWSLEGIALLAAGFAIRERMLRLAGLTLLLTCIGKVFFYDLRNLDTMYRILSFIGLGAVLLAVSWIYTRFREQLQKFL